MSTTGNPKAQRVDVSLVPKWEWACDLQYFDGALLSLMCDGDGPVLAHWCNVADDGAYRWLMSRVRDVDVQDLINLRLPIRAALLDRAIGPVYIIDTYGGGAVKRAWMMSRGHVRREWTRRVSQVGRPGDDRPLS